MKLSQKQVESIAAQYRDYFKIPPDGKIIISNAEGIPGAVQIKDKYLCNIAWLTKNRKLIKVKKNGSLFLMGNNSN